MWLTKYTSEFKVEAIKQVINKGHAVPNVATEVGFSRKGFYT